MADNDTWFERIPGGYYKARPPPRDLRDQRDNYRRRSDEYDRDYYDDRYDRRNSKRRDSHRSRSSIDRDDGRYKRRDDYDDRYEDSYPRGRGEPDDKDNRYQDSYSRKRSEPDNSRNDRYDDAYSRQREEPDGIPADALRPEEIALGGFAAGVEAARMKQEEQEQNQYSGYVPYSNIYGGFSAEASRGDTFSPQSRGSVSSPQPHAMNQVSPPRRTSIVPDAYTDPHREHRGYDGNADYDDDRHARPTRPRPSRLRSRSYDSYDSRDARSWRDSRNGRSDAGQARDKSMSRLKKSFDGSKRGLGYGAIGALAGGLVGSEYGGGVPATIGAVLGGLGANFFEAKEKRKEAARDAEFAKDHEMTARREKKEQERRDSRAGGSFLG